jgi:hypothetical protein
MNICLCSLTTEKQCIDMLNVARMNGEVDIYFAHFIIKEHQFLPPKPQQEEVCEKNCNYLFMSLFNNET